MAVRRTNPGEFERAGASKRRHGRVVCDGVAFEAGKWRGFVVDLSASGARVNVSGGASGSGGACEVGAEIECELSTGEERVKASARVAWGRDEGGGRRLLGLEFMGLTESLKRELMNLLRTAMAQHTMGKSA
ncbi:MAG: PilZ domain-containing protein [Phycisphaerae bacterium]|nr:PilZ domain-containing protein [Phycisphaerae bacterium]